MALVTALSGYYLGSQGAPRAAGLIYVMIGAGLIGGGANALNQYLETTQDGKMNRTKDRPIPSRKLKKKSALFFGLFLSLTGSVILFFLSSRISAGLALVTLCTYLLLYTPLKLRTWLNTFVGALSGALPTLIGWTAATNAAPDLKAWVFFLILFTWQMPHFFAIAWVYREDYKSGGFQMLSTIDADGRRTGALIALSSALLFGVSLLPVFVGIAGLLYFSAAFFTGLLFLTLTLYAAAHRMNYHKQIAAASIFYLAILNIFLCFDKI
jgi:protoheme IX farnesyltransferase